VGEQVPREEGLTLYANIDCGHCGSAIHIDSEWEESIWLMVYRFADAHVDCGTFTDRTELPTRSQVTVEDEGSATDA
jgi:hypothetical protein